MESSHEAGCAWKMLSKSLFWTQGYVATSHEVTCLLMEMSCLERAWGGFNLSLGRLGSSSHVGGLIPLKRLPFTQLAEKMT